ncbi:ankyrin repeat-containing domain protein, partial [Podospora australis]
MSDGYEVVDHAETALDAVALQKIREWLQPTDYLADSGEFRRHLSSQAPGTGLWICETDEYRKWHDSDDHGSLWIKGIPGAGKSVTAASIIQHLRTTEQCPVIFFFFRNIVSASFSPRALIQDGLAQLLPHSPRLQFALQTRLEHRAILAEISDDDLFQHFFDGLSCVPKLYCVADALDEMVSDGRQRPFLDRLNSRRTTNLLHSMAYLRHRLEGDHTLNELAIGAEMRHQIIDMVARRSEGLFLYAKLAMDQILRDLAANRLEDIDIVVLEASLPVGIEQTYSAMLAKQRESNGISVDLQLHVLEAVTHSARPLRLNELTSLTNCIYPELGRPAGGLKSLVASCCGSLVEVLEDETLQIIHHSLTEFLRGDTRSDLQSEERAAHNFPRINSEMAHKRMAMNCLQYLQSGSMLRDREVNTGESVKDVMALVWRVPPHKFDYDEEYRKHEYVGLKKEVDPFNYRDARLLHPFLAYAVEYWSYHAGRYDVHDDDFYAAITSFIDPSSLTFLRWLILQWGTTSETKGSTDGIPHALHIAAFAGLSKFAVALLTRDPASGSVADAQRCVPLHWAAENGHTEVARVLIEHGSNPDAEDGRGLKPIHLATKRNHVAVVKLLLEAGVEPDTAKTKEDHAGRLLGGEGITRGQDAIFYACAGGHAECLMEMIPYCKPEIMERLLCESCQYSRSDAVNAILKRSNVSPNAMYQQATALYFACQSADIKSVAALLQRGADPTKTSTWLPRARINGARPRAEVMYAPIHSLVQVWDEQNDETCRSILRNLVDAGADLEQLDGNVLTPLLLAVGSVQYGSWLASGALHLHALRALLEAGADFNRVHKGKTALHVASRFNNLEAIRLLVERGCDPHQKDNYQDTALLCAMRDKREGAETTAAIVKYFIAQGADLNYRSKYGHTAVSLAMEIQFDLFRTLLYQCQDATVKKNRWFKLARVGKEDFAQFLDLLLADGIDIETRDSAGNTLYLRCLNDSFKIEMLKDHGANPCAVNDNGENALFILSSFSWDRSRQHRKMESLIAAGIKATCTDKQGNTFLHLAAGDWDGDVGHVKWLLDLGMSLSAVNHKGQTPLHVYLCNVTARSGTVSVNESAHFLDAIADYPPEAWGILNHDGLGAVHLAAMKCEFQLAKLVEAGASLGLLTEDSQNVLHLTCRARRPGILCQILNHYPAITVDIDARDKFHLTPLHVACSSGQAESVALLLKHGADIHALGPQEMTALHFCAQFPLEQGFWDPIRQPQWLRGPSSDPLRPSRGLRSRSSPGYLSGYDDENAVTTPAPSSSIGVIAKSLIKAGINVGAVDTHGSTVLDIALRRSCADIVEIFASDEELFQAVTEAMRTGKGSREPWDKVSKKLRAHMVLARPRSGLADLQNQGDVLEEVLQFPHRYLDLLSVQDAADLINKSFVTEPSLASHRQLLERLLRPKRLAILEKVPRLLKYHESYPAACDYIKNARKAEEKYYDNPAYTTLQMACSEPACNLETLRFLVETVGVDVNARYAYHEGSTWPRDVEIVPGGTALHVLASAKYYWQVEGLRYLLTHGAEVDALDEKGRSPLHIAAWKEVDQSSGRERCGVWGMVATRVPLDHGADLNLLDKSGLSPVYKASSFLEAVTRGESRLGTDGSIQYNNL